MLGASSAFADDQVRAETVKFQDLNVVTPAGVEALYGRIHAAAKRVCSESDRDAAARIDDRLEAITETTGLP